MGTNFAKVFIALASVAQRLDGLNTIHWINPVEKLLSGFNNLKPTALSVRAFNLSSTPSPHRVHHEVFRLQEG